MAKDITWVTTMFEYPIDVVTREQLGSDYSYRMLVKNLRDAERFNYHSDYWGDAEQYQEDNVELMDMLEQFIGERCCIQDHDGYYLEGTLDGMLIDKQYNSIGHTCILFSDVTEEKTARKTAFEYDDPITYQKICEQVADLIPGGEGVVTVYDNAAEVWTWRSWATSFYLETFDDPTGDGRYDSTDDVKQRCQSVLEGLRRGYDVCWDGVTDNITRISYDWDCAEWHQYWMVPPFEKTSGIIASERNAFIAGFEAGRKTASMRLRGRVR